MTSEGLGKMFEGDFAEMCTEFFWLMSMGGQAEVLIIGYIIGERKKNIIYGEYYFSAKMYNKSDFGLKKSKK
jgi:hypothetical protein